MKTFGTKVREARKLLNMNQTELGELVEVSARTIVAWESDVSLPRQKKLNKLAKALNVSAEYLKNDAIDDPAYGSPPHTRGRCELLVPKSEFTTGSPPHTRGRW